MLIQKKKLLNNKSNRDKKTVYLNLSFSNVNTTFCKEIS